MIQAAQYVRMSTDQQPLSIDTQKQAIAAYAALHDIEIVQTYCDEARSGLTLAGRAAMQQLLRDVLERDCPYQKILVLDVSRWGRFQDVDESAYYEYHCRKNGVQVEYVSEAFAGPQTPFGSILKQLKRAMAAEYSRELGLKVRAGHMRVVQLGFATGAIPCLGYRRQAVGADGTPKKVLGTKERKPAMTDRVRWVLGPPEEVEVVRQIFADYAAGTRLKAIARWLNRNGVTTHEGKPMTDVKVSSLLKNPIVIGTFAWGRRRLDRSPSTKLIPLPKGVENTTMVQPIVDELTWTIVQNRIQDAVRYRKEGFGRDAVVERLRLGLQQHPHLRSGDFRRLGLPSYQAVVNADSNLTHFPARSPK